MIVARFGYEAFSVKNYGGKISLYTISDLSFEYGKDVETQGTTGQKPISYIKALKLIKTGFKIHLDSRFVNIEKKRTAWQEMSENRSLYAFSIGGKMVGKNKFVVTSVKESNLRINNKGEILSLDLDISIEEYAGKAKTIGILQKRLADYE